MPIIQLTPTQRLISTPRTWEWQHLKSRKHRKTGEQVKEWEFYRNYPSRESALTDVANTLIRLSSHEDMLGAIREVKNAMATLCKAITLPIDGEVQTICQNVEANHEI